MISFVVVVWWWWIDRDQLAGQFDGADRKIEGPVAMSSKCLTDQFTVNNETDPSWLYLYIQYNLYLYF